MKTRTFIAIAISFLLALPIFSQETPLVTERVYLAPSLTQYAYGDTVQVSGQVLLSGDSNFYPLSRYVYVELIDAADSVRVRQKVRCDSLGAFRASIPLPGEVDKQICHLRGYTQFMLCDTTYHYPEVPIKVGTLPERTGRSVRSCFFPEGGALTAGKAQRVALWLCDENGSPLRRAFKISDSKGNILQQDTTSSSGLCIFTYMPEEDGNAAVMEVDDAGKKYAFSLPLSKQPVALQATTHGGRVYCSLLASNEDSLSGCRLFLYHPSVGRNELSLQNGAGIADLRGCSSGLVTLWLTDKNGKVTASRALWLSGGEKVANCEVSEVCQTGKYPAVTLADTLPGSRIVMRILPEDETMKSHAFETLCLLSELSSSVPFPTCYYEAPASARNELEAWLYTAQSARLQQLMADSVSYPYAAEQNILLTGRVNVEESRKALPGAKLLLFNTQTLETYSTETNTEGRFSMFVNDFSDGTPFYVQVIQREERNATYAFHFDGALCPPVEQPASPAFATNLTGGTSDAALPVLPADDKVQTLGNALVRARRPYRTELSWKEKHIQKSPMFYMSAKEIERRNLLTLEQVLRKMEKVQITRAENSKHHPMRGKDGDKSWGLLHPDTFSGLLGQDDDGRMNMGKVVMWRNSKRYEGFMQTQQNHGLWLDFVVDGLTVTQGFEDLLSMPASDLAYLELVEPSDPRSAVYNAPYGYVEIRHKLFQKDSDLPSDGVTVYPQGLFESRGAYTAAPKRPGNYRVLIDIIASDHTVQSFERSVRYDF